MGVGDLPGAHFGGDVVRVAVAAATRAREVGADREIAVMLNRRVVSM
jgi:hypothetical protein